MQMCPPRGIALREKRQFNFFETVLMINTVQTDACLSS